MQIDRVYLKLLHTCCSWQKEVKKEYYFGPVLCRVWSTVCEHQGDGRPYCAGLGEEISWETGEMPSLSELSIFSVYFTPTQKFRLSSYLS